MASEDDRGDLRFVALYDGVVVDIADPLKVGRVRLRVPGVLDGQSGWALPMGAPGGGEEKLGFFAVPPVGADVSVWFVQGDVDRPRYLPGNWGAPGGRSQAPTPVQAASVEEAPNIRCFETPRYLLVFDDRPGKQGVELVDKVSGDGVVMDGVTRAMKIKGTTALVIEAVGAVDIRGLTVTINGRPVLPGGPIR